MNLFSRISMRIDIEKGRRAGGAVAVVLLCFLGLSVAAKAQTTSGKGAAARVREEKAPSSATGTERSEAYYSFAMGHIAELLFESTNREEYASQALNYYKRAYGLDPKSTVIGERLAEMYWKTQRIKEAVQESAEILKRDPSSLAARRLLARIYLRSLGDLNAASGQTEALERAAEQYREILRLDPTDTESGLWLVRLYRLQNQNEKAEEVLRGLLRNETGEEAVAEQLSQLLLDEGKTGEAVQLLEGLTQDGTSADLLELLGNAYTQAGDLGKAEGAYRKAAEAEPADRGRARGLGQTLFSEGKFAEALEVYKRLAEAEPADAEVHLRLAQIYRELHQLDKAENSLLKARQYAPNNLEVQYNEALLYEAQGRFDDAIRVLSGAVAGLKGSGGNAEGQHTLAVLYQQLGMLYREVQNYSAAVYSFEEMKHFGEEEDRRARLLLMDTWRIARNMPRALEEARAAAEKYPNDGAVRASQALLLSENGQVEQAAKLLESHMTGTAADRENYINLAQVRERARQYKQAEESARKAESLAGGPGEKEAAWFLLGAIYERQKMFGRAEEEFKKALAVNPRNAAVLNYYGYMLGEQGVRLEEAHGMVQRALAEEPYSGAYLDSLGWIYYKQNKLVEAEEALHKALERESHDPTIHSHLGDVYFRGGHKEKAVGEWEKALAEWRAELPAEVEGEKVAELEKKLSDARRRVAAHKPAAREAKP
ncbi:MAG: tetratricopeptide repeat protein [Acidobacteriia bacterium]|nr:tetratricopeptide repeat protein [Terriglobia bacterium]